MSGWCLFDTFRRYYGPIVSAINNSGEDDCLTIYPVFPLTGKSQMFPKDLSTFSQVLLPYWFSKGYYSITIILIIIYYSTYSFRY